MNSVHIRRMRAEDFDDVLKINAECSPHVAKLDAEDLRRLAAPPRIALVATDSDGVVGYTLAIASTNVYEGEEFRYFLARLDEPFLYIDQIAVCTKARGANIASRMHVRLQQRSHELGLPTMCCEVNLKPANPGSMKFHSKLGFRSMGQLENRRGERVALLRKQTLPKG